MSRLLVTIIAGSTQHATYCLDHCVLSSCIDMLPCSRTTLHYPPTHACPNVGAMLVEVGR